MAPQGRLVLRTDALLNDNGSQVGELVGAAFGEAAKTKFNGIWSAHNGYFVDYTKAVAADDARRHFRF